MRLNYGFSEDQVFLYLLGELNERERDAIEKKYFADPLAFEYINAVEDHFIDTFLQKTMPWRKRRKFQRHYLSSSSRREKVALAWSIMRAAGPAGENIFFRAGLRDFFQIRQNSTAMLWAGTAAVMLAASLILGIALARSRTELRAKNEQLQQLQHFLPNHSMASVRLEPGIPRGSEQGTGRAVIPADTKVVQIELDLTGLDASTRYRVRLQDASGKEVLEQSALSAQKVNGNNVVLLPVNARLLVSSDYLIILEREDGKGHFSRGASYGLALARR